MDRHGLTLRRLRANRHIRELAREITVDSKNFIQPYFVVEGLKSTESILGLTGTLRDTEDSILKQIESDLKNGVSKGLFFFVPKEKRPSKFSWDFACRQIKRIKSEFGSDFWLATDVCLCSSTDHGQCGVLNAGGDHVLNANTVEELANEAYCFAQAGADCVAPSDMMDGRVKAIRTKLDQEDLGDVLLMSYAAKFHSKFYGPFRNAADSAPKGNSQLKDRATYQIDPGNIRDAFASAKRDVEEGADVLMVKPGMPYLDILYRLSQEIEKPWAAYEVSGEYAAIELMAEKGLISREGAHLEAWTALRRAGAQMIISYGSRFAKQWILGSY